MKFKVGDKVKHEEYGIGEIVYIQVNDKYCPYAVKFEKPNDSLNMLGGYGAPRVENKHGLWCSEEDLELVKEELKNLIPQIAKMLGVEIGEEFYLPKLGSKNSLYIIDTEFGLVSIEKTRTFEDMKFSRNHMLAELLLRPDNIKKLPQKPKLTEDERVILRNLPKQYKWIARDESETIYIYTNNPKKFGIAWHDDSFCQNAFLFNHLFQFIKLEDSEAYAIWDLLYEKK